MGSGIDCSLDISCRSDSYGNQSNLSSTEDIIGCGSKPT